MGKRYYCEYCDKAFQDNPNNRRNHLNGVQHRALRKLHYDSFLDPETILAEDAKKTPCKTFLQTGNCRFLNGCKFSHLLPEERNALKQQIIERQETRRREEDKQQKELDTGEEIVKKWLQAREKNRARKQSKTSSRRKHDMVDIQMEAPSFTIPSELSSLNNLPLSILPPSEEATFQAIPDNWG